jgi:hypothetical protein
VEVAGDDERVLLAAVVDMFDGEDRDGRNSGYDERGRNVSEQERCGGELYETRTVDATVATECLIET